jgi:hypothetical protein
MAAPILCDWLDIPESDSNAMIDHLLLKKIPLAGIARVPKLFESWLQSYINQRYDY